MCCFAVTRPKAAFAIFWFKDSSIASLVVPVSLSTKVGQPDQLSVLTTLFVRDVVAVCIYLAALNTHLLVSVQWTNNEPIQHQLLKQCWNKEGGQKNTICWYDLSQSYAVSCLSSIECLMWEWSKDDILLKRHLRESIECFADFKWRFRNLPLIDEP